MRTRGVLVVLAVLLAGAAPARAGTGDLSRVAGKRGCLAVKRASGCTTLRSGARSDASVSWAGAGTGGALVGTVGLRSVVSLVRDPATRALRQVGGRRGCLDVAGRRGCRRQALVSGVYRATVSPDGRLVALLGQRDEGQGGLNAFVAVVRRDPRTGALAPVAAAGCRAQRALPGCTVARGLASSSAAFAFGPDGRSLYVWGTDTLAVLSADAGSGALSQAAGPGACVAQFAGPDCTAAPSFSSDSFISQAVFAPDGQTLYVVVPGNINETAGDGRSGAIVALRRAADGTLSPLACYSAAAGCVDLGLGYFLRDVTATPGGLAITTGEDGAPVRFVTVRRGADGSLSDPQSLPGPVTGTAQGALTGDGLLVATARAVHAFALDADGVRVTDRGCLGADAGCAPLAAAGQLATSSDGRSAYLAGPRAVQALVRDPATGAITPGSSLRGGGVLILSADGRSAALAGKRVLSLRRAA